MISNLRKKIQMKSTMEEMCRARARSVHGKSARFHAPSGLFYLQGTCVQLSGSSPNTVLCRGWGWCLGVLHTKAWLIKSLATSDWFNLQCLLSRGMAGGRGGMSTGSSSHPITCWFFWQPAPILRSPLRISLSKPKMLNSSKKFQGI